MAFVQHGENLFLCADAVARAVLVDVLEVVLRDGHNEVAIVLPFEPLDELDVALAGLALVERVVAVVVVLAGDVIAVDGFVKVEIRLALDIAARFETCAEVVGHRLRDPDDGVPDVPVAEIEHARAEDLTVIAAAGAHVLGDEPVDGDAVVVFGVPFEETPGIGVVSVKQDAVVHRLPHDVIERVAERLEL